MKKQGQGALEYLLLIGGALIVTAVVVGLALSVMGSGSEIGHTAGGKAKSILEEGLEGISTTSLLKDNFSDGDYTTNPQWSEINLGSYARDWQVVDCSPGKCLKEQSNSGHAFMTSQDLGNYTRYTINLDATMMDGASDYIGIAFGVENLGNWYLFRLYNPLEYYPGAPQYQIVHNWITRETELDDVQTFTSGEFQDFKIVINGNNIKAYQNNILVIEWTDTSVTEIPIRKVGVYTRDNDGGVYYTNINVTGKK